MSSKFYLIIMDRLQLGIILCILVLTGCQVVSQPINKEPNCSEKGCSKTFLEAEHGYSIVIPAELPRWTTFSESMTGPNYPTFTTPIDEKNEIRTTVFYPNNSCSPSTLCTNPNAPDPDSCSCTVTAPQILQQSEDTFTVMGKFAGYPCPVDHCDDSKFGMSQYKGRYVFYSTHDQKTVRIEVNQIVDNPQLAEDIFKTFRWTKE